MERASLSFDLQEIDKAYGTTLSHFQFCDYYNQISLLHRPNVTEKREYDLVGGAKSVEFGELVFLEELRSSYFYEIYQTISQHSETPVARMRLMKLAPMSCYSFHHDSVPPRIRYHVVVKTNPQSFICIDQKSWRPEGYTYSDNYLRSTPPEQGTEVSSIKTYHVPRDGGLYQFNSSLYHTALNGSLTEDRIHLLISTK